MDVEWSFDYERNPVTAELNTGGLTTEVAGSPQVDIPHGPDLPIGSPGGGSGPLHMGGDTSAGDYVPSGRLDLNSGLQVTADFQIDHQDVRATLNSGNLELDVEPDSPPARPTVELDTQQADYRSEADENPARDSGSDAKADADADGSDADEKAG